MIKLVRENIVRYLPFIIPAVAIIAVLVAIRIILGNSTDPNNSPVKSLVGDMKQPAFVGNLADTEERLRTLEEIVTVLAQKVNGLNTSTKTSFDSSSTLDADRLKALEASVNDLKSRVSQLEVTPTPTSTSSQIKSPLYIPIGSSSRSYNDSDWTDLDALEVTLNSNDYSGYSNVYLEGALRLFEKVGTVSLRLYNVSDNSEVSSATISTTADKYEWVTSSGFKLASGNKTYKLQIKSSSNTSASLVGARLKITF